VKDGGLFNHGMWPRSHCTRRCRPTAFAGHHRRWRSYSKGSDSSERYSRSSPGRALSCMWIRRWLTLEEALNMLQRWCVERRRRKPNWRAAIGTPPEGLGQDGCFVHELVIEDSPPICRRCGRRSARSNGPTAIGCCPRSASNWHRLMRLCTSARSASRSKPQPRPHEGNGDKAVTSAAAIFEIVD